MESAYGMIAEVAAKVTEPAHMATTEVGEVATLKPTDGATPEPADGTSPEPADGASSEPTDMVAAKTAAGSSDEITSNPPSHMTASPAVASASSAPRRRDVRRRSGQGNRKGKDDNRVQHRTLGMSSRHWTVNWSSRSDWRAGRSRSD